MAFGGFSHAAKVIEFTAGLSKPPFVIADNPSKPGIQLDLIKAIFAVENKAVHFLHMPLARSFANVDKWHSDAIITLPRDYQHPNVFISAPYISYENVVVSLKESNLSINHLNDLKGKEILAFQKARKFLGVEFASVIEEAKDYHEVADQMRQIRMLFAKRTQLLVLDISIFKHFLHNYADDKYRQPYKVHRLFKPRIYAAGFKSKLDRDQFNRGLQKIKANGKYQKILDKYLL
jgi:polar amino acid transport system substrate-binding protein